MMMAMWRLLGGLFVVALTTTTTKSERSCARLTNETTRPYDANNYPSPPLVNFDPAFIGPLSTKIETPTSTGRVGFAGWISPNTPVGAEATGRRWDPGWFALGFTIEWGGPPPAPPAKRPPLR